MPATTTRPVDLEPTWQCPDYPPPWLTPPTDHGYDPHGEPDEPGDVFLPVWFERLAALAALVIGLALLIGADALGLLGGVA